jgi:glycosyltransferase involved in cell wall biosynthesis
VKKIIFTVTTDLSYDQRMQRVCSSLAAEGYEVLLVGRVKKTSVALLPTPYQTHRLSCVSQAGKFFYIEYNLRLLWWLLWQKFDAVCAIDLDTILPAVLVGKLKGKKIVYDAHEYFTEVEEVIRRPAIQKMWRWIERQTVPQVHATYTVSASLAKLYEKQYNKKFEVVRNIGEPLSEKEITEETTIEIPKKPYLIYIGAVNAGRGLEQLIEAMPQIECNLQICGDGDILEQLKTQAADLGLSHKIKFWGYVAPPQLKLLTANAHIGYLLLNDQSLSYYYSLANKFFDYINAEIPQITSDFPEYRLLNEQHQIAELIPLEVPEIVRATQKLLSDTAHYQQLVENTRLAKRDFCWANEAKTLKNIYKQLFST